MKKFIFLSLLLCGNLLWAQPGDDDPGRREKFEAMRAAFITERLDLTPEVAQKFWPVYNEYQSKLHELRKNMKKHANGKPPWEMDIDKLSDAEVKAMMLEHLETDTKELEIKKKYHQEFLKVLTPKQTLKLYFAEEEFKRELFNRFKKGRPDSDRRP